ncbi:Na+-transporting methylmalonyl-CoA/oxaloacetate decarboxylase gamma subunit [Methanohalophilus levihalophilus]|uniref:hypothetical protein n=1 Tax=Methanohalophilus levihalophilus TaxID=1431282 RepID=UPI001AEA6FB3|nr:hypothetical protein [Methanohalophilus levihalophilus]MBP2029360.1 Na+-transporting methylmalonyl-CoA/oxaloacetate decarboxylase gamma subunit [Methanohalophilus levihalophilus]
MLNVESFWFGLSFMLMIAGLARTLIVFDRLAIVLSLLGAAMFAILAVFSRSKSCNEEIAYCDECSTFYNARK